MLKCLTWFHGELKFYYFSSLIEIIILIIIFKENQKLTHISLYILTQLAFPLS